MSAELPTEHHLEILSGKGGCTGSSESTLVKILHCWKSYVTAHMFDNHLNITIVYIMCCIGEVSIQESTKVMFLSCINVRQVSGVRC